ncbi:MAG: chemotaxis protein CheC [Acidobacteriota bacterium]
MKPSSQHFDALSELMNIGVGRSAGMLNEMLGSSIELIVPSVKVLALSELEGELGNRAEDLCSFVRLPFHGPLHGTAALVFPPDSAAQLVAVLTGEELGTPDLDSVRAGTLSEVGNIVINGVMGSFGNILRLPLTYDLPSYFEGRTEHLMNPQVSDPETPLLLAHARFTMRDLEIDGTILLIFEVSSFESLLTAIDQVEAQHV